ncbi:MAG: thioredoxin family protein [Alphaproteobacteria bacterium]|nr:thioredoxin family protein [Alphaproteobacteria bacterium]MCZ6846949.1 thioredoxin family protein [Alphaproteobacteria bacterium]
MAPAAVGAEKDIAMAQEGLAEFNEQNFDSQVLERAGLTVVDFWSQTCVPCRQLAKVLKQLASEVPDSVQIGTVKAEENIALFDRYGIRSTPTLLFFKDGDLVETRTGVDRRQVLKKVVEQHA